MAASLIKRKIQQTDGSKLSTAEVIVRSLRAGAFLKEAARSAGVSERTVHNWLARGQEHVNEDGAVVGRPPKGELVYVQFLQSVEKARAEIVIFMLAVIKKAAAEGVWQAAAWFLERTRPDEYGRSYRLDVGGEQGAITMAELLAGAATEPSLADGDPDI